MLDSSVYQFFEALVEVAMNVRENEWSCVYQGGFVGERIARRIRKETAVAPTHPQRAGGLARAITSCQGEMI